MFETSHPRTRLGPWLAAGLLWIPAAALGADFARARTLFKESEFREAIELLIEETDENPAHEAARILLAEAYEKSGMLEEATSSWEDMLSLSRNEKNLMLARRAVSRLRRIELDRKNEDLTNLATPQDVLKIPLPEIDWAGLEVIEDAKLKPPPAGITGVPAVPPIEYASEHFIVYSHNERLSEVIAERAEGYLEWVMKHLLGGRSWASRFPIIVSKDVAAHQANGGGGGGTAFPNITGAPDKVMIYQLDSREGHKGEIDKYSIESVLTHELTHTVLMEMFGGQKVPWWLHEACAGRFEQSADQYLRSARYARGVVFGEYFRFRDLFEQEGYPSGMKNMYFYEQGAVIVTFLFETGPEAMHVFLSELIAGRNQDEALAAVLGIPVEGAIEEFERLWVEWMRIRYIQDLDRAFDAPETFDAGTVGHKTFLPWVNELDTVENIETWRDIELASLAKFVGVGRSIEDWSSTGDKLRCGTSGERGASILGMRMNEVAPVVVTCDVNYLGTPGDEQAWFGFTQLDVDGHDTRAEVLAAMPDSASHKVVCLWTDDLVLYLDGVCVGRYPAYLISGNEQDVDYPLAFVSYGPVEIQNVKVGMIKKFSDEPVVAAEEEEEERPTRRGRRGRRRDTRRPRRGGGGPGG